MHKLIEPSDKYVARIEGSKHYSTMKTYAPVMTEKNQYR